MTFEGDIAVIELAQRITFDRYKQPVALAKPSMTLEGVRFNGTGWGTLRERGESSQRLRRVRIPFVSDKACRDIYEILGLTSVKVRKGMLCAGKYFMLNEFHKNETKPRRGSNRTTKT